MTEKTNRQPQFTKLFIGEILRDVQEKIDAHQEKVRKVLTPTSASMSCNDKVVCVVITYTAIYHMEAR